MEPERSLHEPLRTWIVTCCWWRDRFEPPGSSSRSASYQVESVVPRSASRSTACARSAPDDEGAGHIRVRPVQACGMGREFRSSSRRADRSDSIRQVGDFTCSYLSLGDDNPDFWKARRPGQSPVSTRAARTSTSTGP
jgi:hypothetical protein